MIIGRPSKKAAALLVLLEIVSAFSPEAHLVGREDCGGRSWPRRRAPPSVAPRHLGDPSSSSVPSFSLAASDMPPDLLSTSGPVGTALIVSLALVIGVSAQSFINSMLDGDRGLGAFLSDGSGYSGSGFKPRDRRGGGEGKSAGDDAPLSGPDPLPWLKLPELDFVDVAGQDKKSVAGRGKFTMAPELRAVEIDGVPQSSDSEILSPEEERRILERLEDMAGTLRAELRAGNLREAEAIRAELEGTMDRFGIRYEEGFQ